MDNTNKISTPKSFLKNAYFVRTGIILSNISLLCLIVSLSSVLSAILSVLVWLLGFAFILVTLGIILLISPGYWNGLMSISTNMGVFMTWIAKVWPYFTCIGIVSSIGAIVFLALDKNKSHMTRLTFSAVVLALIVVVFISILIGGVN